MRMVCLVRLLLLSLVCFVFALAAPAEAAGETRPLAAGGDHTCALKNGGAVLCWGNNQSGQLGNGTTSAGGGTPVAVTGLGSGVAAIAAGYSHTCALTTGGALRCWGANEYGELGNGATANSNLPVTVTGLASGVAAIATGSLHTCALTTGRAVLCWGNNEFGQLGNGTTESSSVPVAVPGLASGVLAIDAGYKHTCALMIGGGVLCWGWSDFGQLGNGSTAASYVPVAVTGLSTAVVAIAAGGGHTCAITTGGGALCWGYNEGGQLGNGATANSSVPVAVTGLASGVATIAAGGIHTCAMMTSGGALCWGDNELGGLGNGATANSSVPVAVTGLASGVTAIDAGSNHACALTADGGARCWGYNHYGQLGIGTAGYSPAPVAVKGLASGVSAISAGGVHACALTTGGGVLCWGYGGNGELGNGTAGSSFVPVPVTGLASGVAAIAAGFWHNCARTTVGGAWCWGYNGFGELGNGTTVNSSVPVAVTGLASGVTALAVGDDHTCALTTGGGVSCWGRNESGQLGDGTNVKRSLPAAVTGLASGVAAITAGYQHSCALTTGGAVLCWGLNVSGQLGDGTTANRSVPVAVTGLASGVAAIAASGDDTCAVTTSGALLCWGYNGIGELGNGTTVNNSVPVTVTGLASGVAAVAASGWHTCALTTGGGVLCWGYNNQGQLGEGTAVDSSVPVAVTGLASGVAAIATGNSHNCALTTGGGVRCWGSDTNGELGDGHVPQSDVPVTVIGFSGGSPEQVPALGAPGLVLLIAALGATALASRPR